MVIGISVDVDLETTLHYGFEETTLASDDGFVRVECLVPADDPEIGMLRTVVHTTMVSTVMRTSSIDLPLHRFRYAQSICGICYADRHVGRDEQGSWMVV